MITNPLISVIVPVYNVENYVGKCIESILQQVYTNIEILLVNDGSKDSSGKICNDYATKDDRIIVLNKENGGLSDARNFAIDRAKGEYFVFIDSDDMVSSIYVETLHHLISQYKTNMAVTLAHHFKENEAIIVPEEVTQECKFSRIEALESMLYQRDFDTSAWAKIYHKSLFETIRYPKGLIYEDVPTTYKLILKSNGVAFKNQKNYYYLLRDNSIEGSPFSPKKFESVKIIINDLHKAAQENPQLQNAFYCRILSLILHVMFETPKNSDYERNLFEIMKKYRVSVLKDKDARKKARIAALLSYGGAGVLRFFYNYGKSRK